MSFMTTLDIEVIDGTAVTHYQSFVSPFITQDLHQQTIAVATG